MRQSVAGVTTMTQYLYDAEGHRVAKGTIQPVMVNGVPTLSCDTTANGQVARSRTAMMLVTRNEAVPRV